MTLVPFRFPDWSLATILISVGGVEVVIHLYIAFAKEAQNDFHQRCRMKHEQASHVNEEMERMQ
jgi:hypothetical protein